jgi:metal-dependent amidase/aminoacylase/carboxypeptidase family protein
MNNRTELIRSISAEATEWRHQLHQNPQTMYDEVFANTLVCETLRGWDIAHESGIARTGVVATIEGRKNESGRVVAFRADMDALDILEESGQEWSSRIPGKNARMRS